MHTIRKEIASIGDEDNKTAFNLWESPNECVFECQGRTNADGRPNHKTAEEHDQEDANAFK